MLRPRGEAMGLLGSPAGRLNSFEVLLLESFRRIVAVLREKQILHKLGIAISLAIIAAGVIFTTLFKRRKRLQREQQTR